MPLVRNNPFANPAPAPAGLKLKPPVAPLAKLTTHPIDISKWMERDNVKNRIDRLGAEMEGGWTAPIPGYSFDDLAFDRSIFKEQRPPGNTPIIAIGEAVSLPLEPVRLFSWMYKFHPQVVDHTCGLHFHMSFKSLLHYAMLMDTPDYQTTVIEEFGKWAMAEKLKDSHPLWDRLKGGSIFCQTDKFWPDMQAAYPDKDYNKERLGHRYTAISYPFNRYGTIECRLLPMMETAEQSVSACRHLIAVTNAVLASLSKREQKFEIKVEVNEEPDQDITEVWI